MQETHARSGAARRFVAMRECSASSASSWLSSSWDPFINNNMITGLREKHTVAISFNFLS